MQRWVQASVSLLRCRKCAHRTPHLTFSGDTDMVTTGLSSLSSVTQDEIVVAEADAEELSDAGGEILVSRISALLERDDLRFVRLLRAEVTETKLGLSFQEFRAAYEPPALIFSCPHCGVGEAEVEHTISPTDYVGDGGKLTILPKLEIRC